jgi:hypothetical protein
MPTVRDEAAEDVCPNEFREAFFEKSALSSQPRVPGGTALQPTPYAPSPPAYFVPVKARELSAV